LLPQLHCAAVDPTQAVIANGLAKPRADLVNDMRFRYHMQEYEDKRQHAVGKRLESSAHKYKFRHDLRNAACAHMSITRTHPVTGTIFGLLTTRERLASFRLPLDDICETSHIRQRARRCAHTAAVQEQRRSSDGAQNVNFLTFAQRISECKIHDLCTSVHWLAAAELSEGVALVLNAICSQPICSRSVTARRSYAYVCLGQQGGLSAQLEMQESKGLFVRLFVVECVRLCFSD
jgi:hypothetical protein